jgi:uncharacterized protein
MSWQGFPILSFVALLAVGVVVRADDRPSISVSGTGKIVAVPDVAEIQVGVVSEATTAKAALEDNNKATNALHAILKERGVAAKDIQTTRIQIQPQYSQPEPRPPGQPQRDFIPKIVGYRVENTVHVTARQIEKLGALLDALVEAGANQVHGISFRVNEPEKVLDEARRRAVADARRKAELLAGEADVVLGPPLKIVSEDETVPRFPPMAFGMRAMAAPAPMPVAPGEQELNVTVRVVYELKRAK